MKAILRHGALEGCATHDKTRTFRKGVKPRSKCHVCWCVYLADKLETSIYQDDMEAFAKFAGTKPVIEYEEVSDADV